MDVIVLSVEKKMVEYALFVLVVGIIKLPVMLEFSCVAVESNKIFVSDDVVEKYAFALVCDIPSMDDVVVEIAKNKVVEVTDE